MNVGDPFVRHVTYCFEVLLGRARDQFNDAGAWPSREPAEVSTALQADLVDDINRWSDLVKKYAAVSQMAEPREMLILCLAAQRWLGPVVEIGTFRGVTTCLLAEALNALKRDDLLYTIETFRPDYKNMAGGAEYPGDAYLKAVNQFRTQKALERVVAVVGDSKKLGPLIMGVRPAMLFYDGEQSVAGLVADLSILRFLHHPMLCIVHDVNIPELMRAVLLLRSEGFHFANFHTGAPGEKGLAALSRL